MTVRGHQLGIDWSQSGTYTYPLEDVSSYVKRGDLSVSWGRDVTGEAGLKASAGQMTFELNNHTQVFSPENTASAIAGKVLPNRRVRYQATAGGATSTLLDGVLDSFTVDGDQLSVFSGTALDGWGRPGAEKISTALFQGIRTGDAINLVLDAIGWTGARDIDAGVSVLPWWWEEATDAATAVDRIVASEGAPAIAFVEGGTFTFKDRHHRIFDARCVTSQALYTHIYPAGSGPGGDFKIEKGSFTYDHGAAGIVNTATFSVGVRTVQPLAEVWTSEDALVVGSGETVQVVVQASSAFLNAVTPSVESGDVVVQSGAVTAVSLSRTSGQSAILSVTSLSGAVVSRLAVRANSLAVSRTEQVTATDAGSIGRFGQQEWPEDASPVWANRYDAQVIATRTVAIYANYRPKITFTVAAVNATYLTQFLATRISDRITVRNDRRGVNADFVIEKITHQITSLGLIHRLTIVCQAVEPTQPANIFTFDQVGRGFNQGSFGLDGIDSASTVFRFGVPGQGFDQGVFGS
jgi:hypothetical protein